MDYRLGNSKRIKQKDDTVKLICPHCGKEVKFGVFTNRERRLTAELPIPLDCHDVYFLICPSCASAFGVKESAGKSFKKGAPLSIGNFDLVELKNFKPDFDDSNNDE